MKAKEKLLEQLIKSLKTEPEKWEFYEYTLVNKDWGIKLWIANIPILSLSVYRPVEVKFSLLGRIKLYKAVNHCKAANLLRLMDNLP